MRATVAGAPVSFGVFELTPDGASTMSADDIGAALQQAGYSGIDLGPAGFLGRGDQLRARLRRFGLSLAGGWIQLPFSDDEAFDQSVPLLRNALSAFSDAADVGADRLPLPTLADDGSALRTANPGRGADVDPLTTDAAARLYANVDKAARMVREAGFEPTFHHHAGTFVESPQEVDAFLAHTDVGLTLDTGHLYIAGGDPIEAAQRWGSRINHLHLKDVDREVLRRILSAGGGMTEVWSGGSFVAFGQGDVDLAGVMSAMDESDFDGWIVVEQDVLNAPDAALDDFATARTDDQRINREALRQWA